MDESFITLKEIKEQPKAIKAVIKELENKKGIISNILSDASTFCFLGCGTSYYLSLTGSSLINEINLGLGFPGSEIFVSPNNIPKIDFDVIIPISRSGESAETVRATKYLKKKCREAIILSITCKKDSKIDKISDISVISRKGGEESVVMTKSFSSMLASLEYLSKLNSEKKQHFDYFQKLPQESRKILKKSEKIAKRIANNGNLKKYIFLGPGEYYGLASEAMLKMEEMTLSWSKAYHPLEFRHGPRSLADENTLVTTFIPRRNLEEHKNLVKDVRDLNADTLVIGREKDISDIESDHALKIPPYADELGLPLLIPFPQLLGYYGAIAKNLNPDNPQNLTRVVKET